MALGVSDTPTGEGSGATQAPGEVQWQRPVGGPEGEAPREQKVSDFLHLGVHILVFINGCC